MLVIWRALSPISVRLENEQFSCDEITVLRYDESQLNDYLGDDIEYWPKVSFDLDYKTGYWLKFELEVDSSEDAFQKLVGHAQLFFEALALFKSTRSILLPAGFLVKKTGKVISGLSGHFGMENTILGMPKYFLKAEEYNNLRELFGKYKKFWLNNKVTPKSNEYLQRINWAKYYFIKAYQTMDLRERYIFLSIALEALCGEGQGELQYRYANRAALLLGDTIEKRKETYNFIIKAYDTRSKILHGSTKWKITLDEVLIYTEAIRQMVLRCISLYSNNYLRIGKALDDCLHDPNKHAELLKNSKVLFVSLSDYKEPELKPFPSEPKWRIRK